MTGFYPQHERSLTHSHKKVYSGKWVIRLDSRGIPYEAWERDMPPVMDAVKDCVIYLYRDSSSAANGKPFGGSGFLVGVLSEQHKELFHLYAVTNRHVIEDGFPVIRLNTTDGEWTIINKNQDEWILATSDDLALCPIGLHPEQHKFRLVNTTHFVRKEEIGNRGLCLGDEVFMVGRLINNEGKQQNIPTVRTGIISMLPQEPLHHPRYQFEQESYLIEMKSISGYSGSPVFTFSPRYEREGVADYTKQLPYEFIGIDYGHVMLEQPVIIETVDSCNKVQRKESEKYFARTNTGMAKVIPSWRLRDILYDEEFKQMRQQKDAERESEILSSGTELDTAVEKSE